MFVRIEVRKETPIAYGAQYVRHFNVQFNTKDKSIDQTLGELRQKYSRSKIQLVDVRSA